MTDSIIDVFGPGFMPGKVPAARDVASRAMSRSYAKQSDAEASAGKQHEEAMNTHEQSSASAES